MVVLIKDLDEPEEERVIQTLVFCSELKLLITASENLIKIWKLTKGFNWNRKPPQILTGHKSIVNCLSYLYLGEAGIILASGSSSKSSCVKLWFIDNKGVWDGNKPESLKIETGKIKSIAMHFLADGGALLAAGGGEYGNNLSVYKLTPKLQWNEKEPLVLKGFTYWANPIALHSFNNDKIILVVSGYWMETFLKLWTFNMQGNWDRKQPLTLKLPPNEQFEDNYLRSFEIKSFEDNSAILLASIASSENDYWICDAGYIIAWFFDSAGNVTDENSMVLDSTNDSIAQAIFQILNNDNLLVASKITYNQVSVKLFKKISDNWKEQNNQEFKYRKWIKLGCFLNTSSEIFLISITENRLISRKVLSTK